MGGVGWGCIRVLVCIGVVGVSCLKNLKKKNCCSYSDDDLVWAVWRHFAGYGVWPLSPVGVVVGGVESGHFSKTILVNSRLFIFFAGGEGEIFLCLGDLEEKRGRRFLGSC